MCDERDKGEFELIRRIERGDRQRYIALARMFYESDAVLEEIPEEHIALAFEEMMRSRDYIEGFFLMASPNEVAGYAVVAKSFSQEAGGMVLWVDELFLLPEYRSLGLGQEFFAFVQDNLKPTTKRIRLEVEGDNVKAISLYRRLGFDRLPYVQMVLDP